MMLSSRLDSVGSGDFILKHRNRTHLLNLIHQQRTPQTSQNPDRCTVAAPLDSCTALSFSSSPTDTPSFPKPATPTPSFLVISLSPTQHIPPLTPSPPNPLPPLLPSPPTPHPLFHNCPTHFHTLNASLNSLILSTILPSSLLPNLFRSNLTLVNG